MCFVKQMFNLYLIDNIGVHCLLNEIQLFFGE